MQSVNEKANIECPDALYDMEAGLWYCDDTGDELIDQCDTCEERCCNGI